ncbi:glycoside hydrolase family 2 [Streptococcus acidominimus]|uniref:N-acetyl-beta-hexosaminidase n=2 Tax=Streptococcus acidominimus TaxID=1326 RepID=A0A1Q8EDS6_STRAI|nr:glycoside hydrolase family 2 [Streptococcus acidominimus]OLF49942.1 hypothetical protein BU200_04690 [Streptococcus acidominimus]SUN07852.1 N-acetyl-beta-hexosaminidase [Streptococcus acidominimus]
MEKFFLQKKCTYSLRKATVGVCSVLIGLSFLSSPASAQEIVEAENVEAGQSLTETKIEAPVTDEETSHPVEEIREATGETSTTVAENPESSKEELKSKENAPSVETKQVEKEQEIAKPEEGLVIEKQDSAESLSQEVSKTEANQSLPSSQPVDSTPATSQSTSSIVAGTPAEEQPALRKLRSVEETPSEAASIKSPEVWQKVNYYNEKDKKVQFDNDWKFSLGDRAGASTPTYDDSSWKLINLPHDFSLTQDYTRAGEAESGYKPGGIGWYRKVFAIGEEAAKGRVSLDFDGAYMETEVFINGQSLGVHPNGYTAFSFDLTDYIKPHQENVLAVKVVNNLPSSRWYSGSGIYRSVHLNFEPTIHLAQYGVVMKTPDLATTYASDTGSQIVVETKVLNQGNESGEVAVQTSLFRRNSDGSVGEKVAESSKSVLRTLETNQEATISNQFRLVRPDLWSLENPNLYILRTDIYKNDEKIQSRDQEVGFRFISFDNNTGFKLNGQAVKLKGVSMHHDQGSLGSAAYYDAIERQFDILKDMGVNAVRVTHNPAARVMKDIANRKGMLLIDEAFDTWHYAKNGNTNDYARWFNVRIGDSVKGLANANANQTWAEYHLKQMVKSGINDPSIIMWSTGNEVMEGFSGNVSNYPQVIRQLINWIAEVDDSRPATLGDNKLKDKWREAIGMAEALSQHTGQKGIVGYNYADGRKYDQGHQEHPDWIIYGSETASAVNSRGVYNVKGNTRRPDKQLTSYDQSAVGWGHVASQAWYDVITRDFVAGEFVWTGFDYLGEPTPWNGVGSGSVGTWPAPKSSYFGIVDTAGFPKDSYYFYRSQWNERDTTLHLVPGTWEESALAKDGQNQVEVVVYSNAAKVKLIHVDENGRETDLGSKAFTKQQTAAGYRYQLYTGADKKANEHQNLYLTWNVPYRSGKLKAVAYDENGREIGNTVGVKEVTGFGPAHHLVAKTVKKPSKVTDKSLEYIEIDVLDQEGRPVITANQPISITVDGPARLVAMDNGNAVDHQSYQDNNRKAYAGKVLAIVQMTGESGEVRVSASAEGLEAAHVNFSVQGSKEKDSTALDSYLASKTIYLKKGGSLQLPQVVRVRYQDGSEGEKALTFDQEEIAIAQATGESFVAKGTMAETGLPVDILVSVIDQVAAIKNISLATERGQVPTLPDVAQAYLADGSLLSSQFPVEWELPANEAYNTTGLLQVNGHVNVLGDILPIVASIRVADKTITIGENVAPVAVRINQDIPANQQSDTLSAINNRDLTVSSNDAGGPNPTIWSNYEAAQAGDRDASISFTYDTAQNITRVVAYYHRDSWSLRLPKSVQFSWSRGNGEEASRIEATEASRESVNGLMKIVYNLANPVPAVVFTMTVENSDEDLGNRKPSVGLAEVELLTAVESFERHSDASLTEIRIDNRVLTEDYISPEMTVLTGERITAFNRNSNVAITVLPAENNMVKIFTESEDKSRQGVYTLHLVPESPSDDYVPLAETTVTAGSTQPGEDNRVENTLDAESDTIWHSAWAGTDLANLWLSLDAGKVRKLNGLAYVARSDGSPNGKIIDYKIYASTDQQNWQLVKTGQFNEGDQWQEAAFEPIDARYIKLQAVHTLGDGNRDNRFMSAAEIRVRELKEEVPQPEPEQPQPDAGGTDGTVELADSYIAPNPPSAEAVEQALRDPNYLTKEYTIYPKPRTKTYGDGLVRLDQGVNLVIGSGVDIYTRNRIKEVLQTNQISYTTSATPQENVTNIFLGIHGQDTEATRHQASEGIASDLYNKIDAYSLVIRNGAISVVGKDTDAVFYGLTSLKHILKDSPQPVLRELKIEDFADIKNRGFIEGYYGNPWSNQDRAELMKFGGDLKLTQYFFAPKDDPYHNSRWRDLYPEEKLAEIKELARVGNQSKTRYVWTIHPFMHNRMRFDNDTVYQEDLAVIKAKFSQLLDAGVREFGILADDAPNPAGGFDSYNRLMRDLTDWLGEKQSQYSGLRKEMIFVPHEYWGNGREAELKSLNQNLPATSSLTLTGGRIWGEVSSNFLQGYRTNITADGASYRPIQLWINWPTTDNSKQHLILGGGEKFLHPNVDPSLLAGIMLNPMQQSEPSKIALFSVAQYTWDIWESEEEARRINDQAFNFVETGTFRESEGSRAFRELGKHMINQNMDSRVVKLEESLELAPKLTAFLNKLEGKQDVSAEREELLREFKKLKDAALYYKANGHERMKEQIVYWLDNTVDQMDALEKLLEATKHIGSEQTAPLWENYKAGLDLYKQSQTHEFWYVNGYQKAELGVQHIRPFILTLLQNLSQEVETALDPSQLQTRFITNREVDSRDVDRILDGDLSTHILSSTPNTLATGDYVGLEFNRPVPIHTLGFAMGTAANLRDTFSQAELQYLNEQDEWVVLRDHNYRGNEDTLQLENLSIKAKAVRLIATASKSNTWLGVREIAINRPLEAARPDGQVTGTITTSNNLIYKYGTNQDKALDGNPATEAMYASSDGSDTTPSDSWIQLNLDRVRPVSQVTIIQGSSDKIANGVVEYSEDGVNWQSLATVAGEQNIILPTNIRAKAIRIKNQSPLNRWWRIAEFKVESQEGVSDYTDTSVDSLQSTKTLVVDDVYRMGLEEAASLNSGDYIGLRLDRIHELADLQVEGQTDLTLLYSPNGVEWYPASERSNQPLARYIRLVNQTDTAKTIGGTSLTVTTKEIESPSLDYTSLAINPHYGDNDVRTLNNLGDLFDGKFDRHVQFADAPRENDMIILSLGQERAVKKVRAYIQDGTVDYLRDGKIQVSADGQNWVDLVTIGDGVSNAVGDDSLTDGWVHDSENPGNRYIEGSLDTPVNALYLRILATADYPHRFLSFTELVLNDGEFVKQVNDPTVVTTGKETRNSLATNLVDGKVLTSYRTKEDRGELLYRLSENTHHNHITLVSNAGADMPVRVQARVTTAVEPHAQNVSSQWIDLGSVDSSFATLILPASAKNLLDIKLSWESPGLETYELKTYHQPLEEEEPPTVDPAAYHRHKVNQAIGATATANDTETDYWGADKAIDGIINPEAAKREQSRWATNPGSQEKILTIRLSEERDIEKIKITWERENIKGFRLESSLDGQDYRPVYSKTDDSYVRKESVIQLDQPTRAREIRLIVDNYDGGDINWASVSLYELELIGSEDLENLAYKKTASASASEDPALSPDKAFDGKLDTRWASSVGHDQKVLSVDLGEVRDVASVVLEWERKNASHYAIEVSQNGQDWTRVKTLTAKPEDFTDIINLDQSQQARYVRLLVDQFDDTAEVRDGRSVTWATVSLYELNVFGKKIVKDEPQVEEENQQSLEEIARQLQIPAISGDMGRWTLPQVPDGVTIEFIGADFEQIIDHDLTVYQPLVDTTVSVNYRLKRGSEVYETPAHEVLVSGKYQVEATDNAPLRILPGLAEWKGLEGHFMATPNSRIVVHPKDKEALKTAVESFQEDYRAITGRDITIVYAETANAGDFYFELNQKDAGLKTEGYRMTIGDAIQVEASHQTGAFWSTQTLLQSLKQDKDKIAKGLVRDYPKYSVRGFVLDVGRKPVELSTLKAIIKTMSWYKMNDFQIHLNDNYIWVEEFQNTEDPYGAYSAFRLESSIKEGGNGGLNKADLTAKDHFYTKKEFKDLIAFAKERGIQIVPEIDAPAHSLALTKVRPDLVMRDKAVRRWVDHLEVSDPASLEFVKEIWNDYIDGQDATFAGTDVIHLGVDEFEGNNEAFRAFTDALLKYAISKGKTPRFWGSLSAKPGTTPVHVEGAQMNVWNSYWAKPKDMYQDGYTLINTLDEQLYIVPKAGYYADFLNGEYLYNNWEANRYGNLILPAGSPQVAGAAFAIWNDMIGRKANGIVDYDLYKRFEAVLPALTAKMWGNRDSGDYRRVKESLEAIGGPVGENPYHKVATKTDTVLKYKFNLHSLDDVSGNDYDGLRKVGADYEAGREQTGLRLNGGESYVETPIAHVGPNNSFSAWVKLAADAEGEQILLESDYAAVKLVQKETGRVGYSIENYDHSFNYTLPRDQWVHLTIKGYEGQTQLYINNELVDTLSSSQTGGKSATLTLPTRYIGSRTKAMKGWIDEVTIGQEQPSADGALATNGWTFRTDNENEDGRIANAFDGDHSSIWHTKWQPVKQELPATIQIDMQEPHAIDYLTYIPRQVGQNGWIRRYKIYSKLTESEDFRLIKEGELPEDATSKKLDFDAHQARYLKIEVLEGHAGFGSAAEFIVGKTDRKGDLARLISEAKAHELLADSYLASTIAHLVKVLQRAEAVQADTAASAETVEQSRQALERAIRNLFAKVDMQSGRPLVEDISYDLPELPIQREERSETQPIPFETLIRVNPELEKGVSRIVQLGQGGVRTIVTEYLTVGDRKISKVLSDLVTKEAVDQIVEVGTKVTVQKPETKIVKTPKVEKQPVLLTDKPALEPKVENPSLLSAAKSADKGDRSAKTLPQTNSQASTLLTSLGLAGLLAGLDLAKGRRKKKE